MPSYEQDRRTSGAPLTAMEIDKELNNPDSSLAQQLIMARITKIDDEEHFEKTCIEIFKKQQQKKNSNFKDRQTFLRKEREEILHKHQEQLKIQAFVEQTSKSEQPGLKEKLEVENKKLEEKIHHLKDELNELKIKNTTIRESWVKNDKEYVNAILNDLVSSGRPLLVPRLDGSTGAIELTEAKIAEYAAALSIPPAPDLFAFNPNLIDQNLTVIMDRGDVHRELKGHMCTMRGENDMFDPSLFLRTILLNKGRFNFNVAGRETLQTVMSEAVHLAREIRHIEKDLGTAIRQLEHNVASLKILEHVIDTAPRNRPS